MAKKTGDHNTLKSVSSTKRGLQEGYNRVTFIVREDLIEALEYICYQEDDFLKNVVNRALDLYIEDWQRNNGRIQRRRKSG